MDPISNYIKDQELLTTIGRQLQLVYEPGGNWELPANMSSHLALLDQMALRSNRVYSIFDFERFDYLYCSPNLASLAGEDLVSSTANRWQESYVDLIRGKKGIRDFIDVRDQLVQSIPRSVLSGLSASVCGGGLINKKKKQLRLHYRSHSLAFDERGRTVLSFDFLEDVSSLLTAQNGYWMRFTMREKVFHWHSEVRKLVPKDIVSPREKTLISLWKQGCSIGEIADQAFILPQTVKNQLNNARTRLYARDNTALAQLCTSIGALSAEF